MERLKNLFDLQRSLESTPGFIVLDSLYAKNENSPVSRVKEASQKYFELAGKLKEILYERLQVDSAESARDLPFSSLFSIAEMIIYTSTKTRDMCLEVMNPDYTEDFLTCHSLNVAFLSARVATGMNYSYKEISEIIVAALLHDIGMTRIDADCYHHDGTLSKRERHSVNEHPRLGWEFFKKLELEFPWLLRVILEEHKREGNRGYPEEIQSEIHPYSKIIGVCDAFEALTHKRIFRKAFHPADVMKTIINAKEFLFAKDVLRAMIESLSLYPVGSLVQMNNKKIAQVLEPIPGSPLRPIVQLVGGAIDDNGTPNEPIDLSRDNNLYITGLVYSDKYQIPENLEIS